MIEIDQTRFFIDTDEFCNIIQEGRKAGKKYCFILGSGASKSSGIKTGYDMMLEWYDDLKYGKDKESFSEDIHKRIDKVISLHSREEFNIQEIRQKLPRYADISYIPGFGSDEESDENEENNESKKRGNEDYYFIYELRFCYDADEGYEYFARMIDNALPGIGYSYLADIICNSDSNLVITTNFDRLTEISSRIFQKKESYVVGHEQLADYALKHIRNNRPKILKLHRDVDYNGLNRYLETRELCKQWKSVLEELLSQYIPIVIGFSGFDKDVMDFLCETKLKEIYWCHMYTHIPADHVRKMVANKNGKMVEIYDFDAFLKGLHSVIMLGRNNKISLRKETSVSRYNAEKVVALNRIIKKYVSKLNEDKKGYKQYIKRIKEEIKKDIPPTFSLIIYIMADKNNHIRIILWLIKYWEKHNYFYAPAYLDLARCYIQRLKMLNRVYPDKYDKEKELIIENLNGCLDKLINSETDPYKKVAGMKLKADYMKCSIEEKKEYIRSIIDMDPTDKIVIKAYKNLVSKEMQE